MAELLASLVERLTAAGHGETPLLDLPTPAAPPVAAPAATPAAAVGTAGNPLAITRGDGGPPIAWVIAASVTSTAGPAEQAIGFTDGSVWLVGTGLDATLAADAYVGIAFSAARLEIPSEFPGVTLPPAPFGAPLVVPSLITARLDVTPASPAPPAGPVVDDGALATVSDPTGVTFELAPGGVTPTSLGDAAATVYASTVAFSGGVAGTAVDPATGRWSVGFASMGSQVLDGGTAVSTVFAPSGTAPVLTGAWFPPVVRTTPERLVGAAAATLAFTVGPGLSAVWGQSPTPVPLVGASLEVGPSSLVVGATTSGARPRVDTYPLWRSTVVARPQPSSITLHAPRSTTLTSTQTPAVDSVRTNGCTIEAHLDQPCLADGGSPDLERLDGFQVVSVNASGTHLVVVAAGPADPDVAESYLLRNAVLRTDGVTLLVLVAELEGSVATDGVLVFASDLTELTPTLPDPYAVSDTDAQQAPRPLLGGTIWTPAGATTLFELQSAAQNTGQFASAVVDVPFTTLFDVSSAVDQLGVTVRSSALAGAGVDGQTLTVSGEASALFALPQISWEAVATADGSGERAMFGAFAVDDGPGLTVNVATQELRPMGPVEFLDQFLTEYAAGSDLQARFTLPFGLEADVITGQVNPPSVAQRPALALEAPDFGTVVGGRQLSIAAASNPYRPGIMPGRSFTTIDPADVNYPPLVLDADIASFWNQEFRDGAPNGRPFVPLARIGLSGYGSSTFSDYTGPNPGVGVSEARFDVVVGRTAYTLVQIQSVLCPWGVLVVDTTIFERDGGGWVMRRNTGWRAKSLGRFMFSGGPPAERGGVNGIANVRNIVELDVPHVPAGGKQWAPVIFDADVMLATDVDPNGLHVLGGDIGGGHVAGTRFSGWIDQTVGAPPALPDVLALMDVVGSAAGAVTATVAAGHSSATPGIAMTLTGVDVVATAGTAPRTLGVALRGVPTLPRDGSWRVARRTATQPTAGPVDPLTPVPLVRASADPSTWHLAEPADVLQLATPDVLYSLVQSTGTQQLVFEHPTITGTAGQNPLNFVSPPALADVGALLGTGGLLPAIGSLISFPAFPGLTPVGDGLATTQTLSQTTVLDDTTLIPLGPISVVLATNLDPAFQPTFPAPSGQSVITVVIDPTASPRWSVTITNVAFKLLVDGMSTSTDPLVAVIGDVVAADGQAPTVKNLQFAYGSSLSVVKDVLSGIEALAASLPGAGANGLDVSFTGTKLRVRDAVSLPQLPLGLGYLEGISLDLGFDVDILAMTMTFVVGVGTDQDPFTWLASPLAGNGLLQLGAGQDGLGVRMQGGIGVGLGIDVAIASGSASVTIAAQLDTTKTPFGVMLLLTGNASVDVLDGLTSASLSLTAGLGVQVSPGPASDLLQIPPLIEDYIAQTSITLTAEVAVAIHLTVGWLLHVDWSGSWGFSETVSGSALTSLLP